MYVYLCLSVCDVCVIVCQCVWVLDVECVFVCQCAGVVCVMCECVFVGVCVMCECVGVIVFV